MKFTHFTTLATVAVAALALSACSSGASGSNSEGNTEDLGTISAGYVPGWTDQEAMTFLAKNQLEKIGYTVEVEELADNGPIFAALSQGALDLFASAWPEITHKAYMDEFGDNIESLNTYYDNAKLVLAVPSYSDVDSIADLADESSTFNSEIIGIEPGAGLTKVTREEAMPAYGLDSWNLKTSSTASMLTVLGQAIDDEEDIVVTLWRPFWATTAYDVKELEDPEGAMGEPEPLESIATAGFSEEFPEAAELLGGIKLDDEQYGALEELISSDEYEGDYEGAVEQWVEENPGAFPTMVD